MSPARQFEDPRVPSRRPVRRVGDLLAEAAHELGLEEPLRWARARTAWDIVVAERVPGAAGESRPVRVEGDSTLVVEATSAIVGQELRIRAEELLEAFAATPGGLRTSRLRIVVQGMIRTP